MPSIHPRSAIALTVTVAIGLAFGYALSWDPEAADIRRRAREEDRRWAEITRSRREADARLARDESLRATQRPTHLAVDFSPVGRVDPYEMQPTCNVAPPDSTQSTLTVDGKTYTVLKEGCTKRYAKTVTRLRVHDDAGRVIYDEDVTALVQADPAGAVSVGVRVVEDAGGRARGLLLGYAIRHSGLAVDSSRILAPRGDSMEALTPLFHFGSVAGSMPGGSQPNSLRLLDGDRVLFSQWRFPFEVFMPYRIDFGCPAGGPTCVAPAPGSIAGLARFGVDPTSQIADAHWKATDTTVTVEMFPEPRAARSERVSIPPGTKIRILGGAGRLAVGRPGDAPYDAALEDDWLQIVVHGRTGWIPRGSFDAIEGVPRDP